jgi:hypothetical protein
VEKRPTLQNGLGRTPQMGYGSSRLCSPLFIFQFISLPFGDESSFLDPFPLQC